jgi:hypothetical protein
VCSHGYDPYNGSNKHDYVKLLALKGQLPTPPSTGVPEPLSVLLLAGGHWPLSRGVVAARSRRPRPAETRRTRVGSPNHAVIKRLALRRAFSFSASNSADHDVIAAGRPVSRRQGLQRDGVRWRVAPDQAA